LDNRLSRRPAPPAPTQDEYDGRFVVKLHPLTRSQLSEALALNHTGGNLRVRYRVRRTATNLCNKGSCAVQRLLTISLSLCESAPSWLALNCMGVRICLGQLKSYACDYLERVSRGETLEIARRGRLVAFMVPPFPLLHEPSKGGDHIGAADPPAPDANIPLSQLRKNAAPCFDRVAAGDIIGVLRRGRLVARIVAATSIR
jgi:antitoxin (DNA-binding transcriptional repressor) of toxin-antitoxin stability system